MHLSRYLLFRSTVPVFHLGSDFFASSCLRLTTLAESPPNSGKSSRLSVTVSRNAARSSIVDEDCFLVSLRLLDMKSIASSAAEDDYDRPNLSKSRKILSSSIFWVFEAIPRLWSNDLFSSFLFIFVPINYIAACFWINVWVRCDFWPGSIILVVLLSLSI